MRDIKPEELIELVALFVTLMIFFSIDIKSRNRRQHDDIPSPKELRKQRIFNLVSVIGGLVTVLAAILTWVDFFLPEDNQIIHVTTIFIPGSIGLCCALILGIEVLFLRMQKQKEAEDSNTKPKQSRPGESNP